MQWKQKLLSGAMAGLMLFSSIPTVFAWEAPGQDDWGAASRDGVTARFFVGSDTHIGRNDADKKLVNALDAFSRVDPDNDGVLLVGDITDNGSVSEYESLMSIISGSDLSDRVYLSMGNHDHYSGGTTRFEAQTGQSASESFTVNGVTIIKLNASGSGGDYRGEYDFLKTALEAANEEDPNAPILVMGHHGIADTAYVTEEWNGNYGVGSSRDMVALMAQYPQVIHFSGHSHGTLEDARSIHQDLGFTTIQTSTIGAYFENESGKINPTTGASATRPENSEMSSQALRVDVMEDGSVEIYRMNLTTGSYIYEDEAWTFDVGYLPYTEDRAAESRTPYFSQDASVQVGSIGKSAATVTFPAATEHSSRNLDMIHSYHITVTPVAEGSPITYQIFSDYYLAQKKETYSVKVTGLESGLDYAVSVTAVTSFGVESEAITGDSFRTEGDTPYETPVPNVLNVDFSRGDEEDANGHTLTTYGNPQMKEDEVIGRRVAVFDGVGDGLRYSMEERDYTELMADGFTVELYYKPLDTKSNNPLGNTQSSGFCFEQVGGTNNLQFWAHIGGSYKKPQATVSLGEWNHVVGTYDGNALQIYHNGTLQSSVPATGAMSMPPLYLFLGGDTKLDGSLEYQANCEIALARVYGGAMSADDIMTTYQTVVNGGSSELPDPEPDLPTANMLDVDFNSGTAEDRSSTGNTVKTFGTPIISYDEEMAKNTAKFGGSSAYLYPFSDTKYAEMTDGLTIESLFLYHVIPSSESDIFSSQQSGGIGLGMENGKLQFYCRVNQASGTSKYIQPNYTIETERWYHAVGVFDGSTVKLYLNGELVDEKDAGGSTISWTTTAGAKNFVIGGDSNSNNGVEFWANADVSLARLYNQPMTGDQVAALYERLEPPMIEISGNQGALSLGEATPVPTATASNGAEVSLTVSGPDGVAVTVTNGTITPAVAGTYTFTYTVTGSAVKRVLSREAMDLGDLPVTFGIVLPPASPEDSLFNVHLHVNRDENASVSGLSFDLTYDPALVSYVEAENVKSGAVIRDDGTGTLHITYTGNLATDHFSNYSATRLVNLHFKAKDLNGNATAAFRYENISLGYNGAPASAQAISEDASMTIVARSSLDLNGDGVIGVGDVALATSTEQAELIASGASIYPYKHAVVLTMDGGGISFRPDQMYYTVSYLIPPALTSNANNLAKRGNAYAMWLFNEEFATSYSALAETPTISAQNYTAILHGKEYATAQSEYQIDNTIAGTYFYPDFGKEVPVYPSVFMALGAAFPSRANAAFAEWTQIINGIVEPDAPVYTHGSTKTLGDMQDVADYIRSDAFRNTSMVYMQSDYMDSVGHNSGFYTATYYSELERYDDYFKTLVDALQEADAYDDTIIVINSDHGGVNKSHGGTAQSEYDVFIGLGGQTINSGKRLEGGTNHDIPLLVLSALRGDAPGSMDGTDQLFLDASLTQEELVQKNRDIELVTFEAQNGSREASISLSNPQRSIRGADMVIALEGRTLTHVETEGNVVRQEVKGGSLYLTIAYAVQPETLAILTFDEALTDSVKVTEIMLGAANGKEVYSDLVNRFDDEAVLPADEVAFSVSGDRLAVLGGDVSFLFSMSKADGVSTVTLNFEITNKTLVSETIFSGLGGFTALPAQWSEGEDSWFCSVTLSYLEGKSISSEALMEIMKFTALGINQSGIVDMKLQSVEVSGWGEGSDPIFLSSTITEGIATTTVTSKYDLNGDGYVNQLDLTAAQLYYRAHESSDHWSEAKRADFNGDGVVDILDLIELLLAYRTL